jgi:hypothetical protein
VGQFIENMQHKIKTSSSSISLLIFKTLTGFLIGLTISLVGQMMIGYGTLAFIFVIVSMMLVFYRISQPWKWSHSLVFSLICVLIVLLLRMYILVAPGA